MTERPTQPRRLAKFGKSALVTGASDGIGRATALGLAEKGFDLILVARRKDHLDRASEEARSTSGVKVRSVVADLSTAHGLEAVRKVIAEERPGIGVLSAGYGTSGPFVSSNLDGEVDMLDVNCRAVLTLAHDLTGQMVRNGAGQLVLFGSIVGFQGNAWTAHYAATKAYVQSLAEGLAVELGPHGVHVLSVAPGPVNTGFAARAGLVMGSAATPLEIARGIVGALGSSGTIRPGLLSKLLGYNLAMAPRFLRVRIMSMIMGGMTGKAPKPEPRAAEA